MKKPYYIDYPQEHIEGHAHSYCCAYCKIGTTVINGRLVGHLPTCEYRIKLQRIGHETDAQSAPLVSSAYADDVD